MLKAGLCGTCPDVKLGEYCPRSQVQEIIDRLRNSIRTTLVAQFFDSSIAIT